jgi:hypothetical protein
MRVATGLAAAAAIVLTASTATPAGKPSSGTQILRADFGVFTQEGRGPFRPTNEISLSAKDVYGWAMVVKTDRPTVHWREEFTLPAKGPWNTSKELGTTVKGDGKTAVTERDVAPINGIIFNSWIVAEGDPPGRYVIKVKVDDAPIQIFNFDVR